MEDQTTIGHSQLDNSIDHNFTAGKKYLFVFILMMFKGETPKGDTCGTPIVPEEREEGAAKFIDKNIQIS